MTISQLKAYEGNCIIEKGEQFSYADLVQKIEDYQNKLSSEIEKGDVLRVTVYLKALNRKHNLSCEVVWRQGNQSGVTFLKPDQVLDKMIEKT